MDEKKSRPTLINLMVLWNAIFLSIKLWCVSFFMCIYVDFFLDLISSYLRAECEAVLFFMLLPFFFNCCNVLSTFYFCLLSFSCKQSTWWYVNIYVPCISSLLLFSSVFYELHMFLQLLLSPNDATATSSWVDLCT